MHKQLPGWLLIRSSLQQNIEVMLLYVLESKGSSPGRQGFLMAVNNKGAMSGSLGGGIMEHKFIELAKSKLQLQEKELSVHQQLHDKQAAKNQSGMICSGQQTIFLYKVMQKDISAIELLVGSLQQNKNGTLYLSSEGIGFSDSILPVDYALELSGENDFVYKEKTGYKNELYIIGGGHCSLALSKLVSGMDYYIRLFDHRDQLNTMQENSFIHEKILITDYTEIEALILPGKNKYVVIMTIGYRTDEIALRALLGKELAYLGILGSKYKIGKLFRDLNQVGITNETLNRVYAPIGVQIKSQTTEEIAVSIAAQIIQVKNRSAS